MCATLGDRPLRIPVDEAVAVAGFELVQEMSRLDKQWPALSVTKAISCRLSAVTDQEIVGSDSLVVTRSSSGFLVTGIRSDDLPSTGTAEEVVPSSLSSILRSE